MTRLSKANCSCTLKDKTWLEQHSSKQNVVCINIVNLHFWSSNNARILSYFNWCDAGYVFLNVTAHVCLSWMLPELAEQLISRYCGGMVDGDAMTREWGWTCPPGEYPAKFSFKCNRCIRWSSPLALQHYVGIDVYSQQNVNSSWASKVRIG